jgi:hypothetical protein
MFVMGIIDFGRYFFIQHSLQFATREGTRLALVGGMLDDGQGGRLSREASVVKTIDPTGWDDALSAGSAGQYMRVRTEVPFEFITPFIANLVPGRKLEITAEATYRNELFD